MKISEKSWHYKIVNFCDDLPSDLCTYFWTLVRNLLVGAGIVAIIVLVVYFVGFLGFLEYKHVTAKYIAVEEKFDKQKGEITTIWHVKTQAERNEAEVAEHGIPSEKEKESWTRQRAENIRDFFWGMLKVFAICICIPVFIAFGLVMENNVDYRLAQKISAFSIIPTVAAIILVMYFTGAYQEISANEPGLCAFIIIIHPILIIIIWLVIRSFLNMVAAVIAKLTEEKDLSGADVIVNFVKAKKAKVCPLIDYT